MRLFRNWLMVLFAVLLIGCRRENAVIPQSVPILTVTRAGEVKTAALERTVVPRPTSTAVTPPPLRIVTVATEVIPSSTPPPTLSPIATVTLSPVPTSLPIGTPTLLPVSTSVQVSTVTEVSKEEREQIGLSALGKALTVTRYGNGQNYFIVLAGIHGGRECNTAQAARSISDFVSQHPEQVAKTATVFILSLINPDGCTNDTRHNANNVDLNRNWNTPNWQQNTQNASGTVIGGGGSHPFSEPEVDSLQRWLIDLQSLSADEIYIVSLHAAVPPNGLVQPAYQQTGKPDLQSDEFARLFAEGSGFMYSPTWIGGYTITGEFINWASLNGFIAIDVEFPDYTTRDVEGIPYADRVIAGLVNTDALFLIEEK